ncbi:MAG: hypothetical protein ACRD43_02425, partial [Pyrinomonadaceae bacterium]
LKSHANHAVYHSCTGPGTEFERRGSAVEKFNSFIKFYNSNDFTFPIGDLISTVSNPNIWPGNSVEVPKTKIYRMVDLKCLDKFFRLIFGQFACHLFSRIFRVAASFFLFQHLADI